MVSSLSCVAPMRSSTRLLLGEITTYCPMKPWNQRVSSGRRGAGVVGLDREARADMVAPGHVDHLHEAKWRDPRPHVLDTHARRPVAADIAAAAEFLRGMTIAGLDARVAHHERIGEVLGGTGVRGCSDAEAEREEGGKKGVGKRKAQQARGK